MTATIEVIVKEIKKESPSVKSFKLAQINGSPLPRFSAGSHIVTYLEQDQKQIERHYSLTTAPNKTDIYQIAVRLNDSSKGGSAYWHHEIKEGDRLEISYPRNHFPLSFLARHHMFFAAGIGITPFLAMAADLKAKGKTFELHYAAPSKEQCAFYSYLKEHYPNEIQFYFSNEKRKMKPHLMENKPIGTHVYFCGSEAMMKEYAEAAKYYGYHENSIHFELFSPPDLGPQHPFQVKLHKSNQLLQVREGESLLETLLKNNIQAPYSCRIGGCGSCQVDVLEGDVDHRDLFLSDQEKENSNVMLTCVSRGKCGTLVLDL
ncbi:PDR/VanB family oxidoreductase [Neobacillus cucumis]|uniref:PDR/VanB family oxidoreductase n=1 Tax=Neobacillus cucumis TaxID=1740721 RepID=UPI002853066D|nr:PDR/VanB family oxidoreductase [Neobacillus cucumis]MDR4946446.1 PDR/VanB family oxidoreductase [Neobacillus cucumis]